MAAQLITSDQILPKERLEALPLAQLKVIGSEASDTIDALNEQREEMGQEFDEAMAKLTSEYRRIQSYRWLVYEIVSKKETEASEQSS